MEDVIRIGAAASALGVSIDTLRRWERNGRIAFERRGQQRYMSCADLAEMLRERAASGKAGERNRLDGIVIGVQVAGAVAQVDLACGPYRVVSVIPREVAERLALKPGDTATAMMKASSVQLEKPQTRSNRRGGGSFS
jgi:molybdopterin-binding protein